MYYLLTFLGLTILLILSVFVRVIVSPSLVLILIAGVYSLFWLPQIIRSARRGASAGLSKEYLIGTTVCRSYFALCALHIRFQM